MGKEIIKYYVELWGPDTAWVETTAEFDSEDEAYDYADTVEGDFVEVRVWYTKFDENGNEIEEGPTNYLRGG